MSLVSGCIFRPLLSVKKSEILQYAEENTIVFREDSSNLDITFQRNRIRHTLVPILRDIEPSIDTMFMSLGEYMQEASLYVESQVQSWMTQSEKNS